MSRQLVGFFGLGNMGRPLAANLVGAEIEVLAYDRAGTEERAPDGVSVARSAEEVFEECEIVVLSLPTPAAVCEVASSLISLASRRVRYVIDTSTIGPSAAREAAESFSAAGVTYADAPLSGGVRGALERTVAIMVATSDSTYDAIRPVINGLSDVHLRVGDAPGQGQALKLANNFLAATALVATSEAMALGEAYGLDPATMVDALNRSSGRNSATSDKFPNQIIPGTFHGGFSNSLMDKDLNLCLTSATELSTPRELIEMVRAMWKQFVEAEPGADTTRIYPYVKGQARSTEAGR